MAKAESRTRDMNPTAKPRPRPRPDMGGPSNGDEPVRAATVAPPADTFEPEPAEPPRREPAEAPRREPGPEDDYAGFDEEINSRYEEIKRGGTHISELQQMNMPQLLRCAKDE